VSADEVDLQALTLSEAIRDISHRLAACAVDNVGAEARMLLLGAAGLSRSDLIANPDRRLDRDAAEKLRQWLTRRLAGEPATRIIGERHFWTLSLRVTPDVLDPRPDSETIVSAALDTLGPRTSEPLRILDLGVGSGALLLSMLSGCPLATGVGVDLSEEACAVARDNAVRNGLEARAEIRQGRWTEGLTETFDLVLSNPPYIETATIEDLSVEVRGHDPKLALDGGPDGLDAYRDLASALGGVMRPGAITVLELGIGQGPAVAGLAEAAGLRVVGSKKDFAGVERALILSSEK
jgi:release factor glutamine methyltransferase